MPNGNYLNLFRKYLCPHIGMLTFSLVASVIAGCLTVVYPLILQRVLDSWTTLSKEYLLNLLIIFVAIISLQSVLSFSGNIAFIKATQNALSSIRYDIYSHLCTMPLSFFSSKNEGYVVSLFTNDVNTVNNTVAAGAIGLLTNAFRLTAILVIMLYFEWKITMIVLGLMSLYVVLYHCFGKRLKKKKAPCIMNN